MLNEAISRRVFIQRAAMTSLALATPAALLEACSAAGTSNKPGSVRSFSFGYVEPSTTVDGFIADTFDKKLQELSGGSLKIVQYPNGQLGQEEDMDRKLLTGDIDFSLSASANLTVIAPEAGALSLHYLFKNEDHMIKAMSDPKVNQVWSQMVADKTNGALSLGLFTAGFRNIYSKQSVSSIGDIKGKKIRVQASKTEDAFFGAYGAVAVHMPFGQVYTSLQTGVVQMAETLPDGFVQFKLYEVAPTMSETQHEVDNFHLGMSKKTWDSLTSQQQTWVKDAFTYMQPLANKKGLDLGHEAITKIASLGAKYNTSVDKSKFVEIATPLQDGIAKNLGPTAVQLVDLIRKAA